MTAAEIEAREAIRLICRHHALAERSYGSGAELNGLAYLLFRYGMALPDDLKARAEAAHSSLKAERDGAA